MKKLIFYATEEKIDIILASKIFNKNSIKKVISYSLQESESHNVKNIKRLLNSNKINNKKVDVIFSSGTILTREIEIPALGKSDLMNFVNNNIKNYFTVNIDDFYFDYRVIKKFQKDDKIFFSVLLVALLKSSFTKLSKLISNCNLSLESFNIYPDCIAMLFNNINNSIAILDLEENKSNFTIIDKGTPFVYSLIDSTFVTKGISNELYDNLNYFLNFYSSRHFGEKVDTLYVLGEHSNSSYLINSLSSKLNIRKIKLFRDFDISLNYEEKNKYGSFITTLNLLSRKKTIYNKYVNYRYLTKNKKLSIKNNILSFIIIMFILTITLISYFTYKTNYILSKYNLTSINKDISKLDNIKKDIEITKNQISTYKNNINIISAIKKDDFNYINILDAIRKSLPSDISVNSIDINKNSVKISLNINNKTLDVAKAVIALNSIGIFEPLQISDVPMDDSVTNTSFELKLKSDIGDEKNE